ncbi:MAG: class IV adenylate cyclase [Oscillospiraceae bacterium]|nr:class IV adenylate cyclase [Oscillospiraceae bacterium]
MTEIEIKASLAGIGRDTAEARASALGFRPDCDCREADVYYNAVSRDFRKTDEALRLREHTERGVTHVCLTYKGAKQNAVSQTRQELETAVENGDTMRKILLALGYTAVLRVKKDRRTLVGNGSYAGVNLCLDTVEGLGDYMELEFPAPDDASDEKKESVLNGLLSLLDSLGVPRENLGQKSYLELLMTRSTSKKSSQG